MQVDPWVRKISWRRAWKPSPVLLPGESHSQRSLADYRPQGCKQLDMTKVTEHSHTHMNSCQGLLKMNTALFLFWAFKIFSQQLFVLSILCIISVLRSQKYRGREGTESLLSSDLYLSKKTKYEHKNTMTSIKTIYFFKSQCS